MTITEKLEMNINEVNSSLQSIKSKFVANGVAGEEELPLAEYAQKVDDVYEAGKKSEYDLFWDTYQQNGTRVAYDNAFAEATSGMMWQAGTTYRPKYPIVPTRAENMYYATRLPYEALKEVDFSNCTSFRSTFAYASTPHLGVIDARKATVMNSCCGWSGALTTIDKLIVAETTPYYACFGSCKNLTNITFEGTIAQNGLDFKDCKNLSRESIESVIECLSESATGLTVTFSKASVDKAFETSGGANDGETSDEWAVLVATKPNWTITLS